MGLQISSGSRQEKQLLQSPRGLAVSTHADLTELCTNPFRPTYGVVMLSGRLLTLDSLKRNNRGLYNLFRLGLKCNHQESALIGACSVLRKSYD